MLFNCGQVSLRVAIFERVFCSGCGQHADRLSLLFRAKDQSRATTVPDRTMHASASSLLPLRVYRKYVTLGFHTELVVVDRGKLVNEPKEDADDSLKQSATQTSWVDVQSEAECSALSFDAQDEECRCVDMQKFRNLMRGVNVSDIVENIDTTETEVGSMVSPDTCFTEACAMLLEHKPSGHGAALVSNIKEEGTRIIIELHDLLRFIMTSPMPSLMSELGTPSPDPFMMPIKGMPLEHDDCFYIKAEDSIDELMNWFSQGKRIDAIRNADSGVVTHLISRRALLSFLHSNLKSDWFPTLLTSEVIPLYMIVPRNFRVICVTGKTPMNEVLQTLLVYKISAVAYVSKRKFKGELSIEHLKGLNSKRMKDIYLPVKEFLHRSQEKYTKPITCSPNIQLKKLLLLFIKHQCDRVWVVQQQRLVGLITATSVIRSLYGARGEDQEYLNSVYPARWTKFFQRK